MVTGQVSRRNRNKRRNKELRKKGICVFCKSRPVAKRDNGRPYCSCEVCRKRKKELYREKKNKIHKPHIELYKPKCIGVRERALNRHIISEKARKKGAKVSTRNRQLVVIDNINTIMEELETPRTSGELYKRLEDYFSARSVRNYISRMLKMGLIEREKILKKRGNSHIIKRKEMDEMTRQARMELGYYNKVLGLGFPPEGVRENG